MPPWNAAPVVRTAPGRPGRPVRGSWDAPAPVTPAHHVGTAEDVARSAWSGVLQGTVGAANGMNDMANLGGHIGAHLVTGLFPQDVGQRAERITGGVIDAAAPTSTQLLHPVAALGSEYDPQTRAGQVAHTAGQMLPNALLPGGLAARAASVILPTVGTEIGREADTRSGGNGQAGALVGGIIGGVVSGGRISRVRPRAPPPTPATIAARTLRRLPNAADTAAMQARAVEFRAAGIEPTVADTTGNVGRQAIRAAASRPTPGMDTAEQFNIKRNANLPGNISRQVRTHVAPSPVSADTVVARASEPPTTVTPGQGGAAIHARLNAARDAAATKVNELYNAARSTNAEQALIPRNEIPNVVDNLQTAVQHFDPVRVPAVQREIERLSGRTDITAEDLFRSRSILSQLSSSSDAVEAQAARTARRALDGEIDRLEPAMTGDPASVKAWRSANAARRQFGRNFEGNDLTQRLTDRSVHGDGMANTVAAEDASNVILGTNGVTARPNVVRDLTRIRDTLGANSPEWQALQNEATDRLVGQGTGDFGAAFGRFRAKSPELANLLIPHSRSLEVGNNQRQIAAARAGEGFLGDSNPDELAHTYDNVSNMLARSTAARSIEVASGGANTRNALSVADKLGSQASNRVQVGNALLGESGNSRFSNAMRLEAAAVRNAQQVNPRTGSGTHLNLSGENALQDSLDQAHNIAGGARDLLVAGGAATAGEPILATTAGISFLRRIIPSRRTLSDTDAEHFVNAALDPAQHDAIVAEIDRLANRPGTGQRFLQTIAKSAPRLALPASASILAGQQQAQ